MNIAINTRLLIENELEGIGRFSFEIIKRIVKQHPNINFHLIFDRPFSKNFLFSENVKGYVIRPKTRHPVIWYYWFEFQIPKLLKKINANLFISLDGFLTSKLNIPKINVVHDINFEHRPKDLPFLYQKYYRHFIPKYCKISNEIITVSNFSKNDISKTYKISKNKIHVVYNGVSENFNTEDKYTEKIKKKFTKGYDYFVFIGSLHKRKNISRMLKAFDLFKKQTKSKMKFLIVGKKRWWSNEMEKTYKNMSYNKDVIFTGYVSEIFLNSIIKEAKCLCFVSLFEGFGLPIIEAMKCGTPVITSNVSSMPEICGDSGLIVDPLNVIEIANAMQKIKNDKNLCNKLIESGIKRSQIFNWNESAKNFSKVIEKYI